MNATPPVNGAMMATVPVQSAAFAGVATAVNPVSARALEAAITPSLEKLFT
jgi:hypothetical protein